MHRIMKNKKLLCSVCFLFTFMSVLWGQSITVKGNVTSKTDGQPVIGASVVEATATANGTITDLDGNNAKGEEVMSKFIKLIETNPILNRKAKDGATTAAATAGSAEAKDAVKNMKF